MCVRIPVALFILSTALPAAEKQPDGTFTQNPTVEELVGGQPVGKGEDEPKKPPRHNFAKGPNPSWIWGADTDGKYSLSTTFLGAKTAVLRASCDNVMTLYINNRRVAQSSDWSAAVTVDVSKHLKPGQNEVRADVANQGGPSGFVFKMILNDGRKTHYVISDKSWSATPLGGKKKIVARRVGALGGQPWGNVFAGGARNVVRGKFQVPVGFQVEKIFTVPKGDLGSWVCLTVDPQGRLIASDQGGKGICRITPPKIGSKEETKVEKLNLNISSAQGMLFAFGHLYFSVNGGRGSGFYRAKYNEKDGTFGGVQKLKPFRGGGEHGPHALRLSPDGKSIYVIAGNHTAPPSGFQHSQVPKNWGEDLLLQREWDANGHARGRLAPGGWIAKTDPEGKTWELVSTGYRNPYDMAFNADGELFAYDADMEWDMGSPWYRPTRVVHATGGSEFGWRSGTGKWPTYYVDSLPPVIDIGPGSPVGAEFGYGAKFPAKYQKALYICDWTFGTMYAIHLKPNGSTYTATKEEFVSRTPLPLTDVVIGKDGAMYFTIGGRGTQSELYRVTYVGKAAPQPVDARDLTMLQPRSLRRSLESMQRNSDNPNRVTAFIWKQLSLDDRNLRYAARVALEHQPIDLWRKKVFAEKNPQALITAAVALARQGKNTDRAPLLTALGRLDYARLSESQRLELLRVWQLMFVRLGEPTAEESAALRAVLERSFPAKSRAENRELVQLLVYLKSTAVVSKTIPLLKKDHRSDSDDMAKLLARNGRYGGPIARMIANRPDTQRVHYAFVLRNLKKGWTVPEKVAYFDFLSKARNWSGGSSYRKFIQNMENQAFLNSTDTERVAIEASGARKPYTPPKLPKPKGPGKQWTVADLLELSKTKLKGRNFNNGRKMYAATRCVICHRFAGEGGATGPDLTQLAGRFNVKDLSEALIEPSKVISDQYRATTIRTADGNTLTGRIISETDKTLSVLTDPEKSTAVVDLKKSDITRQKPSATSVMPAKLLDALNEQEVLDLLAYLLSRGNPRDPMFRR